MTRKHQQPSHALRSVEDGEKSPILSRADSSGNGPHHSILESLPVTIFECDESGLFTYTNQRGYDALGYAPEDVIGKMKITDTVVEDERERVQMSLVRLVRGETLPESEFTMLRKDGSTFPAVIDSVPIIIDGKSAGFRGFVYDITQRRQSEMAKHEYLEYLESIEQIDRAIASSTDLEQMLSDVLEVVHYTFRGDRVWLVNPNNPEASSWTCPQHDGAETYPNFLLLNSGPDRNFELAEVFQAALDAQGPVPYDDKSGRPLPSQAIRAGVRSQLVIAIHPRGAAPWLLGMHQSARTRDWTDQEQRLFSDIGKRIADALSTLLAFRDLKESEVKFRQLAENIPGVVYLARNDERFSMIYLNNEIEKLTGYTKQSFLDDTVSLVDLYHPDDGKVLHQKIETAFENRQPFHLSYRIKHANGKWHWLEEFGAAVFDENDEEILSIEGFLHDITTRKVDEQEKRRLEFQMQQTQKLESLGVLGGGIAHDFNNLLMGILGNVSLALLDMPDGAPTHSHLLGIERAAERAAELCNQLLAYSGKGKFIVETLDVNQVIQEIAHLVDVSISKKARLVYECDEAVRPVEADASQVRQIVMNLIINASEALDRNEGVIRVSTNEREHSNAFLAQSRTGECPPEGTYACIEVSDSGSGMDQQALEKIFDPFYTTKFTGRDLGLAAVLGIVRSHGGAIHVDSTPGEGTTFLISLPISASLPEPTPAIESKKIPWSGTGTILLVDDEPIVRQIGKDILDAAGFSVLIASDGVEGIDMFRDNVDNIDLVLLDMTMPRLSGEEVFKEMAQLQPAIPVVISSGYNDPQAAESFPQSGPAGFLQKPYGAADLYATIRQILEAAPAE